MRRQQDEEYHLRNGRNSVVRYDTVGQRRGGGYHVLWKAMSRFVPPPAARERVCRGIPRHHVSYYGGLWPVVNSPLKIDESHRMGSSNVYLLERSCTGHHVVGEGQLGTGNRS